MVRGSSSYGLMWWVESPGVFPSHPSWSSFSARGTGGQALIVVPEAEMVFVHRGDTDHGRGVSGQEVWKIVDTILAAKVGPGVAAPRLQPLRSDPLPGIIPARPDFVVVGVPQSEVEAVAGNYQIAPGVVAEVEARDGFLVGFFPGKGESDFFPVGDRRFDSRALPVSLRFEPADGPVTSLEINLEGQRMSAQRIPPDPN
jgi:hypothetical protein